METFTNVQSEFYLHGYEALSTAIASLIGENRVLNQKLNLLEGQNEILYGQVVRIEKLLTAKQTAKKRKKK